jgi:hypothetical protein
VGIYGSMTQQGTDNIMKAMAQHAGLDRSSILVDIGSGLCRYIQPVREMHDICPSTGARKVCPLMYNAGGSDRFTEYV